MQQDTSIARPIVYDTHVPQLLLRPVDSTTTPQADTNDYLLLCNDSVFAPYAGDSITTYRKSLFSTSSQHSHSNESTTREYMQGIDWMFFVIIALLTLISIYINRIRFNLKDIFASLFNQRVLGRVERENNVKILDFVPMTGIYLAAVAAVATRIATSQLSIRLTIAVPLFYIVMVGILILFLLMKGGLIRLVGSIFGNTESIKLYLISSHLFFFVGGMVLTPMLLFVYFAGKASATMLTIATIFIAIVMITRFIRGLQLILTNSKTSKLYLFYYLCILEIVPILIAIKIII